MKKYSFNSFSQFTSLVIYEKWSCSFVATLQSCLVDQLRTFWQWESACMQGPHAVTTIYSLKGLSSSLHKPLRVYSCRWGSLHTCTLLFSKYPQLINWLAAFGSSINPWIRNSIIIILFIILSLFWLWAAFHISILCLESRIFWHWEHSCMHGPTTTIILNNILSWFWAAFHIYLVLGK